MKKSSATQKRRKPRPENNLTERFQSETQNPKSEIEEKPLGYIIQNLERTFGTPTPHPKSDALEMLIRVVLSQATTDALSERTFQSLKTKFGTWENVLASEISEVAESIQLGGLANQKARVIKELLTNVKAENGSLNLSFLQDLPVREAVTYLKKFRGIGPKTIACTLLFACHKDIFPLDTHIFRVLRRVGLVPQKCPDERAHQILDAIVPKGKFYSLHVNLIRLGRNICRPQEPLCERCPIVEYCDFGQTRI